MYILIINTGSSSLKYTVFYHRKKNENRTILSGIIEGIGEKQGIWRHQQHISEKTSVMFNSHEEALKALESKICREMQGAPMHGVGHRIVHGGNEFFDPVLITPEVLEKIEHLGSLAPLHNPVAVSGIKCAQKIFNEAEHVAVFDSGFHRTLPEHVRQYPINKSIADKYHIQRYGFHGINHAYVTKEAASFLKRPLEECNFISLHLGNGASCCLVKGGKSVDTTMGMTPLSGLMMGTRCGDIDAAIVIYLARQGLSMDEIEVILNKKSGLKGIAGDNDMRHVLEKMENQDADAQLAIDMYVYAIQKVIGGYLTQIESLDSIIFTGGIGENSPYIRERILTPLAHLGITFDKSKNELNTVQPCYSITQRKKRVLVIKSNEEIVIANAVVPYVIPLNKRPKNT